MENLFLIIILVALVGIAYFIWLFRKASKLDFINYPDREISMCRRCQHEYDSTRLEIYLRDLKQASTLSMPLPDDFWEHFCCDALRNKLKATYRVTSIASVSQIIDNAVRKTKDH